MDLVKCNTTAAREHVAEIERAHRTIKERARRVVAELPFDCLPHMLVIHLVYFVVKWLNAVPADLGISTDLSPREIVTRVGIDLAKDARYPFGTYVEASYDDDVTNTMKSRTHGAIYLGTKNNLQQSRGLRSEDWQGGHSSCHH